MGSLKNLRKIVQHPVVSGSFLMVGGNMFSNVINYVYQIYFAGRFLGPVGNGQLGSLFAILYIITIVPISTSTAIVKFVSNSRNHNEALFVYRKINTLIFKVALGLSLVLLVLSPVISNFLHVGISGVLVVPFVLFFSLVTLVNQATLQGALKFWGNVGPNIVSSIFKLVFGIIFVLLGWYVFGAMVGVFLGVFLAYFYSKYLFNKFTKKLTPKGKFDRGKFLKYSLPVLLHSLAFTSIFTVDVILVKHFFPDTIAGEYVALSTLGKIIYFAASPIAGVMFPLVAGRHGRGEKYFALLISSLLLTVAISLGVVGVYFLIPRLVIGLSYGPKYLDMARYLPWMGLFLCFYTVSYFIMNFFLSIDKVRVVLLPCIFALLQAVLILLYHNDLLTVIQISLFLMIGLFVFLSGFLIYNRLSYEKR